MHGRKNQVRDARDLREMREFRPMLPGSVPMVPCSTGSADAKVDKECGTCPSGTDKPPRKATFIATLRCKTVSGQASHRLADALRSTCPRAARLLTQTRPHALKGKAVTASSRLFRSLRLLHNCQLTVLVHPLPASPGRRITPGLRRTPLHRQCWKSVSYIIYRDCVTGRRGTSPRRLCPLRTQSRLC